MASDSKSSKAGCIEGADLPTLARIARVDAASLSRQSGVVGTDSLAEKFLVIFFFLERERFQVR